MAAGDLVVSDFQFELRTTLFGFGTDINLDDRVPIRGLGVPNATTADTPYRHADGAFASDDHSAARTLSLPFKIVKSTTAAAFAALATANTAWSPAINDLPLYFRLPSWGKVYVNGRPRGLAENLALVYREPAEVPILCTFFCPDPTIHPA